YDRPRDTAGRARGPVHRMLQEMTRRVAGYGAVLGDGPVDSAAPAARLARIRARSTSGSSTTLHGSLKRGITWRPIRLIDRMSTSWGSESSRNHTSSAPRRW